MKSAQVRSVACLAALGLLAVVVVACNAISGVDDVQFVASDGTSASSSSGGGGSSSSSSSSSSSTSSGAGGGAGGSGPCKAACDDANPCTADTCGPGIDTCVYTALDGVPTPGVAPVAGDCHVHLCVAGKDTATVDDTDLPKTSSDCDAELCTKGAPSNPPDALGTACQTSGGAMCDGNGSCVECIKPADCTALPPDDGCQTRSCVSNKCGQTFQPPKVVVPGVQTTGDCKVIECDGAGGQLTTADPADLPDDSNPCTIDSCNGDIPFNTLALPGTPCGMNSVCGPGGKCTGCNVPIDCAGYVNNDCKQTTCVGGVCGTAFTANDTPTSMQTAGDCKIIVCDGVGNSKSNVSNMDVPVDGLVCTLDTCTAGTPSNPPVAINTPCQMGYCNGVNACVQCVNNAQCMAPNTCVGNACTSCFDGMKDGTETDVDCGGPACPKCSAMKKCILDTDCKGGQCLGGACGP